MTVFDHPEATLCGWLDIKIDFLSCWWRRMDSSKSAPSGRPKHWTEKKKRKKTTIRGSTAQLLERQPLRATKLNGAVLICCIETLNFLIFVFGEAIQSNGQCMYYAEHESDKSNRKRNPGLTSRTRSANPQVPFQLRGIGNRGASCRIAKIFPAEELIYHRLRCLFVSLFVCFWILRPSTYSHPSAMSVAVESKPVKKAWKGTEFQLVSIGIELPEVILKQSALLIGI